MVAVLEINELTPMPESGTTKLLQYMEIVRMINIFKNLWGRKHKTAIDEIKQAIKEQTGDTAAFFLTESLTAYGKADYRGAKCQIDAGLAENPNHPKLLLWRGMIFFKEKKYKESVVAFREVLKVDPECEDAKKMLVCEELTNYSDETGKHSAI